MENLSEWLVSKTPALMSLKSLIAVVVCILVLVTEHFPRRHLEANKLDVQSAPFTKRSLALLLQFQDPSSPDGQTYPFV